MRTDGRTDMTNLIVAFRNFANATKKLRKQVIKKKIKKEKGRRSCTPLGFYAGLNGCLLPTFRDNISVSSSSSSGRILLTLIDPRIRDRYDIPKLRQQINTLLRCETSRRVEISVTPRRKPEVTRRRGV